MLRIVRRAIVSFPNFAYWRVRLQLAVAGRMPMTAALDDPWYETQNIHLCTIRDFDELCARDGIVVEQFIAVDGHGNCGGLDRPSGVEGKRVSERVERGWWCVIIIKKHTIDNAT